MKALDRLVRGLAALGVALAALSLLASMFTIGYSVVMRYILNHPVPWADELAGYLLVAAVMLAAADALLHGEHIAVDIVTERLSARGRRRVVIGGLLAVAASAALLAVEGWDMVAFAQMVGLKSNGYMAVPMWIPQLLVPLGAVLLGIATVHEILAVWRDRKDPSATREPNRAGRPE
jgi:C4-dicarboxylate transporter DctQ subunit